MFKEFIGSVKSVGRFIAQNPIKSAALGALAITGIGAAVYGSGAVMAGLGAAGATGSRMISAVPGGGGVLNTAGKLAMSL